MVQRLAAAVADLPIRKRSVLGLDIGAGSCGYALLEDGRVALCGVRLFEAAGRNPKGESKQKVRRDARATRVRLRRHRKRRQALRRLMAAVGLPDPVAHAGEADPYTCRAEGLDRRLDPVEWSAALYHIAKRRGFPSLGGGADEDPDDATFAAELQANSARAADYRSVGEYLAKDPRYARSKRNRAGSYHTVFSTSLLQAEVECLFAAQRRHGNPAVAECFEAEFLALAFAVRGPEDGEGRVGPCPFLPARRRGARHAPSLERYLFLDTLTKLRIDDGTEIRRLTPAELARSAERFGRAPRVTFANLRAWCGWPAAVCAVSGANDHADLVTPAGAAAGTFALWSVLGEQGFAAMATVPGLSDAVAAVLTFRNTEARWREGLQDLNLDPGMIERLVAARYDGVLAIMRGAGGLSAAAAARMVPHLARGDLFHDAALAAGLDPLARERAILRTIQNPGVQRAVLETLRQVQALLREVGYRPARLHVEVAEDVAMGRAGRVQMAAGRTATRRLRESARVALAGLIPVSTITDALVERYLLWQEQGGTCLYSGQPMTMRQLLDRSAVQVDHILPRARSGDNSRHNRVVCFADRNQDKGERTPWEWFGGNTALWEAFEARVRASRLSARKQGNLLQRYFAEREARVLRRNLNDTRYAARCVLKALQALYPGGQHQRHLFARPGRATAALRGAWGLTKDRDDPRHHALDALVVAAAGPKAMAALTAANGRLADREETAAALPWPDFATDALAALANVMPSRSELRRGRGQGHGMTVRRVRAGANGEQRVFERRPVWKLRPGDLDRIPDPQMNQGLIAALRAWIADGRPADRPPIAPSGAPIRRVRLLVIGSNGIPREGLAVSGGVAAFGEIARIDIYHGPNGYLPVPVNRSELALRADPPRRAIVPAALRRDWVSIAADNVFRFSLYRGSYVEIVNRSGVTKAGFIRSFDTYQCQLYLTRPQSASEIMKVGIKTAVVLRKFAVDRLGRLSRVRGEALTWHGATIAPRQMPEPAQEKTSLREVA
ncbi:MAG: type II CRISPR RNA-guided endonuclease Cas9 [Alphaproteobacteria bacterium]|nr:type II CRISPR RNA-guided endonuclease Cas9 [Alphaproteobacteria bacterium]